jgi:hypothetical protein
VPMFADFSQSLEVSLAITYQRKKCSLFVALCKLDGALLGVNVQDSVTGTTGSAGYPEFRIDFAISI